MTLSNANIQSIIAERKQRWLRLYDPKNVGERLCLIRYMPELPERPWPHLENTGERVEWAWQKYQLQLKQMEWLDDDTLPFLDVYTGTEIFAAAFGCKTYYPENDMPFAMPLIRSAEEVAKVSMPDMGHPAIDCLFQMADELKRRAGPDALMHLVDIQSPMDIAALIWDKTTFYPAMIEFPDAVRELAHKVQRFLIEFLDEWFKRYGREFIAHYPDYYMPYGITLSEDEVGAVSGRMFNSLFLPELEALSHHYGAIGIHCCAHARHQWSNFLKVPGLKLLNLNQPADVLQEAEAFFADHVAFWPIELPWTAAHPEPARLVYEINVDSKEEASRILVELKQFRH